MKKLLLFAFIALSSVSFGQDLLTAGGFEGLPAGDLTTVSSPWSASGANFPIVAIDPSSARTGTNSIVLPDKYSPLRQSFTAVPGTTYTLTLYVRFDNAIKAPTNDGIFVRIFDGSTGNADGVAFIPGYSFYIAPTTLADGYIRYLYTFIAPKASLVLSIFKIDRLLNDKNSTITTQVHMDDLAIERGVPAALTVNGTAPYSYPYQVGVRQAPTFSSSLTVSTIYRGTGISTTQTLAPINAGSFNATALIQFPTAAEGFAHVVTNFTITRLNQNIIPTVGTYVYNGNQQGPTKVTTTANTTTAPNTLGALTYSYVGISGTDYPATATPPTGAGSYTATATVAQTTNYNEATSAATPFTISKATPTVVPTVGSYTYTGSPQGPNAVTTASTGNVTYNYAGSSGTVYPATATPPTNAGSYTVTAIVAADANYISASSTATSFVIKKAIPIATFQVYNSPVTYNGSAQSALIGIISSSGSGSIGVIATGGAVAQTNAGTYAVTASFIPADSVNYSTLTGIAAGDFVIGKATPTATLAISNSPAIYTGSAQSAIVNIVSSSAAGTVSAILVGGAASQTAAGTYEVVASFVPTDIANYTAITGLVAGNFVIGKATPTANLAVTNSPAIYTGSDQSAIVNIVSSSAAGTVSAILVGGAASQTAAGTYEVLASFVPTDTANYNELTGIIAGNFVIGKATPIVTPVVGTYTFNGSPQGPSTATNTGTANAYTFSYEGASPAYGPSAIQPIAEGSYIVIVTVAADGNYDVASSATTAFTILPSLKVKESTFNEKTVKVYKNNGVLYINSNDKAIKAIEVYDLQGRMIAQQKNVQSNATSISNLNTVRQLLIVKVFAEDNAIVRKKIINN
jgi:hypothetical protein